MAITNAQQARQLYNEGGPMRKIKGQDHMLAYITPGERDTLVDLGGQETMTPEGILAYPPEGNYGSEAKGPGSGPGPSGITGMASTGGANFSTGNNVGNVGSSTGPKGTGQVTGPVEYINGSPHLVNPKTKKEIEQKNFAISLANDKKRTEKRKRRLAEAKLDKKNLFNKLGFIQRTKDVNLEDLDAIDSQGLTIGGIKVPSFITGAANAFTIDPSTKYFDEDSIREIGGVLSKSKTGITGTQADTLADLRQDIQMEDRVLDPNDTVTQSEFTDYMNRNKVDLPDNDGGNQVTDPCKGPNPPAYCNVGGDDDDDDTTKRNLGGLAPRFAGSIFDFTGMADGGRAGAMDGGRMMNDDDPTGGIMDLESGRQMYFLGKLVKKASRAVKKIVKSPIGKAALLGLGAGMAGFGPASGLFGSGKGLAFKDFLTKSFLGPELSGRGNRSGGILGFMKNNPYLSILGGSSILAGLSGKGEEDGFDIDEYYKTAGLGGQEGIDAIRGGEPYRLAADGGLMRTAYAEGSEEPVAKKTMPLLDMDGQEMDLREDGGFVPLGRMERADDVPARLSKNEFVFTADAVRNAGEGDIDKGAEVMYNMMKNLESGGDVSEESQGLEGAREMFQTSQRLEEVI